MRRGRERGEGRGSVVVGAEAKKTKIVKVRAVVGGESEGGSDHP